MKNILINGAFGKMGQITSDTIAAHPDFNLIAKTGSQDNLDQVIKAEKPDIVIDLTHAKVAYQNAKIIIENHVHAVIGTTGFSRDEISQLEKQCETAQLGSIVAPNFSLSAVLMMKFASQAAQYFSAVEIIEMHHPEKIDAPSGTAIKTAELISKHKKSTAANTSSNGEKYFDVPIHSLRLPGVLAEQTVIFGDQFETLSLAQKSVSRACFMPGIILACHQVTRLQKLVYGLENIL